MSNICIIPARGGSKRIPKKNIKNFLGKPIILYSIQVAINSGLFDEVMVSTDDIEIADLAKKFKAKVPFMRSAKNSDDLATTCDVLLEVIQNYDNLNMEFENICCLYPCAPFVTTKLLSRAYNHLIENEYDSVLPIAAFRSPIQRALRVDNDKLSMIYEENSNTRSQDLDKCFYDVGQFYWLRKNKLVENRKLLMSNSGAIKISELDAQDIDNITDWRLAELKFKLNRNVSK